MDFFSKVFNYKNSINCPKVTEDYLESIGVKEKFIWYYDEPENHKYDIPYPCYPLKTIMSEKYDCVVPICIDKTNDNCILLARKGKYCFILHRDDGGVVINVQSPYLTIIPPIGCFQFVVQNTNGMWGVVCLNKEEPLVEFGKYKYLWGFDHGLCLVETFDSNKLTFSNRGIINSEGKEVIRPYTYTDIYNFYGQKGDNIKALYGNDTILLKKYELAYIKREIPNNCTPKEERKKQRIDLPSFVSPDLSLCDGLEIEHVAPPVIPNGCQFPLPLWDKLNDTIKRYIKEYYYICNEDDYNKLLNDNLMVEVLAFDLRNRSLI
mgnify:CR=1 FL=1